jgi:DNA-binding CsgD family transcriptional regulator
LPPQGLPRQVTGRDPVPGAERCDVGPAPRMDELPGRDIEVRTVTDLVRGGGLILLSGPAGIGKSAVLEAVARRVRNAGDPVLSARANASERDLPFGVARQMFEPALLDAVSRDVEASAGRHPALVLGEPADDRARLAVVAALAAHPDAYAAWRPMFWLTAHLAGYGPLLVTIDDLQWVDAQTLRWLAYLARRATHLPLTVLATITPGEGWQGPGLLDELTALAHHVTLGPLGPGVVGELVEAELGGPVAGEFAAACHGTTGGVPLLLDHLLRLLSGRGTAPTAANVPALTGLASQDLGRTVLARLWRSSADAARLAGTVASLDGAALDLAAEVAGVDAALARDLVDFMAGTDLVAIDGRVSFRYPLVRDSVLAARSHVQRQRTHVRAARALYRRHAPAGEVAAYLMRATSPVGKAWVIRALREAAAAARHDGAPELARNYLHRSLLEPAPPALQAEQLIDLGTVELMLETSSAVTHLRKAMVLSRRPEHLARAARTLAHALENESVTEAVDVLDEAAARIRPAAPALADQLETSLLTLATLAHSTARRVPSRLARLAQRLGGPGLLPPALRSLDAYWASLDAERAGLEPVRAAAADALTSLEARTDLSEHDAMLGLGYALAALLNVEEHERVAEYCELRAPGRSRPRAQSASLHTIQARAESGLGRHLNASMIARTALDAVGAANQGAGRMQAVSAFAALLNSLAELGEYDQARVLLADPRLDGRLTDMSCHHHLLFSRGKLRLATGDHRRALEDLTECGRRAGEWGVSNPAVFLWRSHAAVAAALLGDRGNGINLARAEVRLARRARNHRALGVALVTNAVLAGDRSVLAEAVRLLGPHGEGLAVPAMQDAVLLLGRCGHRVLADRLHELVAADRPQFAATPAGNGQLSPHENRLIDMALAGRTNREIAEHFTVTRRAIEFHFTQIYRKLGISGRLQLHRVVSRTG